MKHMIRRIGNIIRNFLSMKKLPVVLALLGLLLTLPSVDTGLQLDDWGQKTYIQKTFPIPPKDDASLMGMHSMFDGDPVRNYKMMDAGYTAWWTYENFNFRMWRPIGEMSHWIDYKLWPNKPSKMHVHSIIFYVLLILAVALMFKQIHGAGWLAGLAALLFAIDDAHGLTVTWISTRYVLIAAIFGVLTMYFHDRWKQNRSIKYYFMALVSFTLGLFTGEIALAVSGYIFAYTIFLDEDGLKKRFYTLVPYGLIAVMWIIIYKYNGFGTIGSGWYVDPFKEPLSFLKLFVERGPIFMYAQWLGYPSDMYYQATATVMRNVLLTSVISCVVLTIVIVPVLRVDKKARFWALGMLISLIPISMTVTYNRVLMFTGLGAFGLLASLF